MYIYHQEITASVSNLLSCAALGYYSVILASYSNGYYVLCTYGGVLLVLIGLCTYGDVL